MTRKTTYVRFFQDAHRINRENQGIYCTPLDEAEGRPRERAAQISKQFEVLACATATAAVSNLSRSSLAITQKRLCCITWEASRRRSSLCRQAWQPHSRSWITNFLALRGADTDAGIVGNSELILIAPIRKWILVKTSCPVTRLIGTERRQWLAAIRLSSPTGPPMLNFLTRRKARVAGNSSLRPTPD